MSVSKEQLLAKILSGKARELCSPVGDKKINEIKSNKSGGYNSDPNPDEYDDYEDFDSMYLSESQSTGGDFSYSQEDANYSNLPENIKESLLKNPIDRSGLANISVLDGMNIPKQKRQQNRQQVNEQISNKQYSHSPQNVDYSIIKAIVNECLNEYFSKNKLNENTLKTIGLKEGKITLVDNKGNTYMAQLEKIGNVNNKKSV